MVNGHSFILIRQMTALVRRALAEVCTVPVLLVYVYFVDGSKTLLRQNPPVFDRECRLVLVDLYNGCKTVGVVLWYLSVYYGRPM